MKKIIPVALLALVLAVGAFVSSAQASPLTGWAWSSNIGWISFNSTNTGGSVAYNVNLSTTTAFQGTFNGYAWSPNIGWISFNPSDLTARPACLGATAVSADLTTGYVAGWARATSGIGRTDGWDGCIHMAEASNGTIYPTGVQDGSKGVTYSTTLKRFRGFGWGGNVLGWTRFDHPGFANGTDVTCQGGNCGSGAPTASCTIDYTITGNNPYDVALHITIYNGTTGKYSVFKDGSKIDQGNGPVFDVTDPGSSSGNHLYAIKSGSVTVCSNTINVTVAPPPPPTSCVQPTHATACPAPNDIASSPLPPGTSPTTVVGPSASCPTTASYCQYFCDPGYKKNTAGTKCISSTITEF